MTSRPAVWIALVAVIVLAATPARAQSGERILRFDSAITVHEDGELTVRETILVRGARQQILHGIYRDFPTEYRDRLGNRYVVGFRVTAARADGQPEEYRVTDLNNGKRVYIGRSNALVPPGEHTYVLEYAADRELGFFDDHDELYWNVTGNGWVFPIDDASATVSLPPGASKHLGRPEAYTGSQGSTEHAFKSSVHDDGDVTFATTRPLAPHEGLTIVVAWPKGYVRQPTRATAAAGFARDNPSAIPALLGGGALLLYYLVVWFMVGRDPRGGTIIPLFHPPDGISPAAARFLVQMGYDQKCFAAALIDMAVKGALTIRETGGVYDVVKKDGATPLAPEETAAVTTLLKDTTEIRLRNANHATIQAAIKALTESLSTRFERSYFVANGWYSLIGWLLSLAILGYALFGFAPARPQDRGVAVFLCVWLSVWTVAVLAMVFQAAAFWRSALTDGGRFAALPKAAGMTMLTLFFGGFEAFGLWAFAKSTSVPTTEMLLALAALNVVFYRLLKAPTTLGRKVLDQLEGFRLYLSVAEKDRLNVLNPPERTPALFEAYLPYALALDVEQQWADQFADVLARAGQQDHGYTPGWYSGGAWSPDRAGAFAAGLGAGFAEAISSASTAPGSSSGGGGGGSSGGGGGGGGGGGW